MQWTREADEALKKVPFFVRKRVRARVEKEAARAGRRVVALGDVKTSQARYLASMASEIKGYQLDTCFGPGGCPNRAVISDHLLEQVEALLKAEDLLGFLKQRVEGELKFHHEFRITLSDCPNACSQPQIKDIGIIGACTPELTAEPCTCCEACVEACKENAIILDTDKGAPRIDDNLCLHCGQCIGVCPTGTIVEGVKGFSACGGMITGLQDGRCPCAVWIENVRLREIDKTPALRELCNRIVDHGYLIGIADIDFCKCMLERLSGLIN